MLYAIQGEWGGIRFLVQYPVYHGAPHIERLGSEHEMERQRQLMIRKVTMDVTYTVVPVEVSLTDREHLIYEYLNCLEHYIDSIVE